MIQTKIVKSIINNGKLFAICLDSTQDIDVCEQTALVLRYVDELGPVERLADIWISPETTGKALYDQTTSTLNNLGLFLTDIVGFSFDGASNMSGEKKDFKLE